MKFILVAGLVAFLISIFGTPWAIRVLTHLGIGQEIRTDGPTTHLTKRGTPTMGGLVIIGATVLGYLIAHLALVLLSLLQSSTSTVAERGPTASAVLLLGLFVGLGAVGFVDDYIKVGKQRSLGLDTKAKLIAQLLIAVLFALLALQFRNAGGVSPASTHLSFARDISWLPLGAVGFVILAYLIITAASNAVNLTDGLDGLATGTAVMVFIAYTLMSFWQFRHQCTPALAEVPPRCYAIRDGVDLGMVAFAAAGACFGFLWWNGSPARIFMGDTGSLSLGGLLAGLAILTRTELLLIVVGALFVIITMSVIVQVAVYKLTRRRVFRMAPLQHHFELAGWGEVTVVIRFWILAGIGVAAGLGLFYADFVAGRRG
ncbi:MAG: phospho-N-acetylmuramoyl-pentapeptide-transferase [Pseudonocardiales bacterium]